MLWARASGDSIIAQFSEELDPESSQNENNFSVSGASIVSAELMSNLRTVKLKVTDMSLEENHSLIIFGIEDDNCLLYTSPSPRDATLSRMPSSA